MANFTQISSGNYALTNLDVVLDELHPNGTLLHVNEEGNIKGLDSNKCINRTIKNPNRKAYVTGIPTEVIDNRDTSDLDQNDVPSEEIFDPDIFLDKIPGRLNVKSLLIGSHAVLYLNKDQNGLVGGGYNYLGYSPKELDELLDAYHEYSITYNDLVLISDVNKTAKYYKENYIIGNFTLEYEDFVILNEVINTSESYIEKINEIQNTYNNVINKYNSIQNNIDIYSSSEIYALYQNLLDNVQELRVYDEGNLTDSQLMELDNIETTIIDFIEQYDEEQN